MCGCHNVEKLVTDAQVARRLGIPRDRVAELAERPGFPRALGKISTAPFWRWQDVQRWARATGEFAIP